MVTIGNVDTFVNPQANKNQAKKVLEESAEVFAAWQRWSEGEEGKAKVLEECADLIQVTCNLVKALGIENFVGFMVACKQKNESNGYRYDS